MRSASQIEAQSITHTVVYTYNRDGVRRAMAVDGVVTYWTTDIAIGLEQVLIEHTPAGATLYLFGLSRLAEVEGSSVEWFLGDGLGSTRQLVDDDGAVVLAQRYDPYGLLLAQYGTGRSGYGFTDEQVDPTGLVYLRARYLHPALGRFLSVDPFPGYAALPATTHAYLYCLDDPINCTDPSGELPPWLEFAAGFGYQYSNDILWGLPDIVLFPSSYQLPRALLLNYALEYVGQLALPSYVSVGIVNSIESIAEAQTLIAEVQAGIQECSPAFQRGRQLGRAISSAQAALEIIGGVATMLGGLIVGPPLVLATGAAGGPAFALTGGAALATDVAVIEAGGAATVHGVGVLAHNLGNPVPNVSYARGSVGGPNFQRRLQQAQQKIPPEWGPGRLNRKRDGWRWQDPTNANTGVWIDQGNPQSSNPFQQVDHVIVQVNGQFVNRQGERVLGGSRGGADVHIPLEEWLTWEKWYSPH